MKVQTFRLPEGLINDMNFIVNKTGMNKSQLVRQGLHQIITSFFQKEKMKNDNNVNNYQPTNESLNMRND